MANPFYIEPASGLPGFTSLMEGVESRAEYERGKSVEKGKIKIRQKAAEMAKAGDHDGLYDLAIKNPWFTDEIKKVSSFHNEELEADAIEAATRVLFGESPGQVGIEHAEKVAQAGGDPTNQIEQVKKDQLDPEAAKKRAELFLAIHAPDKYKALKEAQKIEQPKTQVVDGQLVTITPEGTASASPIEGLLAKGPTSDYERWKENPEEFARFKAVDDQPQKTEYAPSDLKKAIGERQAYLDRGLSPDDPIIKAYDNKISGSDVDIESMTQEEVDTWGQIVNLTGKMPALGHGKQASKIRMQIAKSAARNALDAATLIPGADPNKRPSDAALEVVGTQTDTKAIGGAITLLQKQASSMGSFVSNIEQQIDKVHALSSDLKTYDTRLMNVPLRAMRGKIQGSPLQAKYDMYLAEIESEIGKLATGSTASIAELSATAQNKWEKIHDKNLSVKDMLSLLDETKAAARMRMKSVDDELEKTRRKMRSRGVDPYLGGNPAAGASPKLSPSDKQALDWANSNPGDPRSAKIKAKLGVQ